MATAASKLNLEAFDTPTYEALKAFREMVEKLPLKKVLPRLVELFNSGHHDEASLLYKAWTRDHDYDSRSHDYRWGMMHKAGVRVLGRDEVSFVAASN